MAGTKPWAILVVVTCTIFTAIGATIIKMGVDMFGGLTWHGLLEAYPVAIGFFFYFLGFILLTLAFRYGELSVLFPFVSLSFMWVALSSYLFLGEAISLVEVIGVLTIVLGVVLIGISSNSRKRAGA
jgi:drug/metabolite transporter (DMT)-like permease